MTAKSPIDLMSAERQLDAWAIDAGPPLRLHGYALFTDLAPNFGLADVIRLAFVGELADEAVVTKLEVALLFAARCSIADAAVHAAALSRRYGSRDAGVFGVAALGVAEDVRVRSEALPQLIAWLAAGAEGRPPAFAPVEAEADLVRAFADALESRGLPGFSRLDELSLDGAVFTTMFECGLREAWQMTSAVALAKLPLALAEAFAHQPGALADYPMNVPPFAAPERDG